MNKTVTLGLIGMGTVGTGVVKMLEKHPSMLAHRIGSNFKIKWICDLSINKKRTDIKIKNYRCTNSYKDLLNDPEVDIIVELIGGYEPARTIVVAALNKGKHVVTANKAILAKYWDELFTLARKNNRLIYFEASVGGGIPVVQALNEGLAGNHIYRMMGI